MITQRRNPEIRIARAGEHCAQFIAKREGMAYRSRADVPVTLDGCSVSVDRLWLVSKGEVEYLCAAECKVGLSDHVVDQSMRWIGMAQYIWCVVSEPGNRSAAHDRKRDELQEAGVGLMYFQKQTGECVVSFKARLDLNADVRLLRAAFDAHDGSLDPEAGSASAKRMTAARCKWDLATSYLCLAHPSWVTWKEITRARPALRKYTAHQAEKAIRMEEWLGAEVDAKAVPYRFRYAGGAA